MAIKSIQFNKFEMKSNVDDTTVDLRGSGTPIIEYRESIFMPYVEITAYIIDTGNTLPADDGADSGVGLLDAGLAQGTETILFNIEDEFGNKINFTRNDDLRVASVRGNEQGFSNNSFQLKIVSKEAFDNTLLKSRCNNKFSGRISDLARAIIRENLKSPKWQSMNTDETLNEYHAWGEDRTPFEFLLQLQQLAIPNIQTSKGKTARGNTAGYLFWQTATGYQFKSLDKLFDLTDKTVPKYIENSKGDESLPFGYDGKILWSNMSQSIDALGQFETGAWGTQIHVFNDVDKTYQVKDLQSYGKGNGILAGRHLPQINNDYLDDDGKPLPTAKRKVRQAVGQTVVGMDSLKDQVEKFDKINYNVEDTIIQSTQNYRQKMSISAEIVIAADFSLNAGDLIFLCFPELSTKATPVCSPEKSGIYMIADLCHYGTVANSFTGLHLVRDSFGVKT